jgi:hypothetical protein
MIKLLFCLCPVRQAKGLTQDPLTIGLCGFNVLDSFYRKSGVLMIAK